MKDLRDLQDVVVVVLAGSAIALLTLLDALDVALVVAVGSAVVALGMRHPGIAACIYAFSIPFESSVQFSGAFSTMSKMAGALMLASFLVHRWRDIRPSVLPPALLAWTAWAVLSLTWVSSESGLATTVTLIQLVAATYVVADLVRNDREVGLHVMLTYSIGASLVAVIGLSRFFDPAVSGIDRASAFANESATHFGAIMVPVIIFALWLLAGAGSASARSSRLVWVGAVVLLPASLLGLIVSGTRSAWIAVVFGIGVLFLSQRRFRTRATIRVLAITAMLVVVTAATIAVVPRIGDLVEPRLESAISSGGSGRVNIWAVGLGIARDNPIVGVGFGDFESEFNRDAIGQPLFESEIYSPVREARASHSIYIAIAAELGIIGLALWVMFLVGLFVSRGTWSIAGFSYAALAAYLVQGLFLDVLNRKYFWLVVGLAIGLETVRGRERYRKGTRLAPSVAGGRST